MNRSSATLPPLSRLALFAGALIVCVMALGLAVRPSVAAEDPAQRVSSFASQGFELLANEGLTSQERRATFRKMLDSYFDLRVTGRVALGRHWKGASDEQRVEYTDLFHQYVVAAVANRMQGYSGETLAVEGTREVKPGEVLVASKMNRPDQEPVRLEWRLLEKDGEWRIVDLVVEGVSMAITQRNEFDSVIKTGGGDVAALIQKLREQTASL